MLCETIVPIVKFYYQFVTTFSSFTVPYGTDPRVRFYLNIAANFAFLMLDWNSKFLVAFEILKE